MVRVNLVLFTYSQGYLDKPASIDYRSATMGSLGEMQKDKSVPFWKK